MDTGLTGGGETMSQEGTTIIEREDPSAQRKANEIKVPGR
jgi:hypothetical protein